MQYRTIWISDVHLGTRGCSAEELLEFLRTHESETLYLVGDIIDGWRLQNKVHWPQSHNDVVQKILRKARKGTRVIYIPGNHDEFLREFIGEENVNFGNIELAQDADHITADGREYLVFHGDAFDDVIRRHKWLAHLGDAAYNFSIWANIHFNKVRKHLGYEYWSLSSYLKQNVKKAVNFITDFEHQVTRHARRSGYDGVICGHIHHAEMREIDGIFYCNTGDWVESRTALVEHMDGRLELIHWDKK